MSSFSGLKSSTHSSTSAASEVRPIASRAIELDHVAALPIGR